MRNAPLLAALSLVIAAAPRPSVVAAPRPSVVAAPRTPAAAVAELLAADRAASSASARTTMIPGLTAMMASDVVMPLPGRGFADGIEAVRAELSRDTLNPGSRAEWAPVRGGISADGQQGFTFGYITVRRVDGTAVPGKYLAYWVKGAEGWRVAVYKRSRRPEATVDTARLAPALPARLVPIEKDAGRLANHWGSLMQAERDFARESQTIGLHDGFRKFGTPDAMNMGGGASAAFVIGNEAIATLVSQGENGGSSVNWAPDRAIVASSGDFGVTIGFIEPNAAPANGGPKPRFPFFTIWRRASPDAPWRYVAE